jgi:hypothetical protein
MILVIARVYCCQSRPLCYCEEEKEGDTNFGGPCDNKKARTSIHNPPHDVGPRIPMAQQTRQRLTTGLAKQGKKRSFDADLGTLVLAQLGIPTTKDPRSGVCRG